MENLIKYTDVDVCNVSLLIPKKDSEGVFSSEITYNGHPFYVQCPIVSLNVSSFSFELVNNGVFFNIFESLASVIIDLLHKNSASFFDGKTFSKERLCSSLDAFYSDSEGTVTVESINKHCTFLNSCNEEINIKQGKEVGACIIHIDTIVFQDKKFHVKINTKFLKTLKTQKQQVFLEDRSDSQEPEIPEPEIQENDDDLEFFS